MAQYALVAPDDSIHTWKDDSNIDFSAGLRAGYRWLPVNRVVDDQTTQSEWIVKEPWTGPDVLASEVRYTQVLRNMSNPEVTAAKSEVYDKQDKLQNVAIVDLYRLVKVLADNAGIQLNPLLNAADNSDLTLAQIKNRVTGKL